MIQGSDEWVKARLGRVTASRVSDVIARTKSGYAASRANYMAELIAERLTGEPAERYVNANMQWGTETEAEARAAYAFLTGADVTEVGFIDHPYIPMSGASPDGLVGDDGMLEIKCPNTSTHIDTLLSGKIPAKYTAQMRWQMACARRGWVDFVSYDPRLPDHMRIFVSRLTRSISEEDALTNEVAKFVHETDAKLAELRKRFDGQ